MPDSNVEETDDGASRLNEIEKLAAMSPVEADSLFSIITLPERVPIAWGKSLVDPNIVNLCAALKQKRIAFSIRPVLFLQDSQRAAMFSDEDQDDLRAQSEVITESDLTPDDRRAIVSGTRIDFAS